MSQSSIEPPQCVLVCVAATQTRTGSDGKTEANVEKTHRPATLKMVGATLLSMHEA